MPIKIRVRKRGTEPIGKFVDELRRAIKASPSQIYRYRAIRPDPMKEEQIETVGPYEVRLEPYPVRTIGTWDEKGSATVLTYQLLGYGLPINVISRDGALTPDDEGRLEPLFKVDDTLVDENGLKYRIASPQYTRAGLVWVNVERI